LGVFLRWWERGYYVRMLCSVRVLCAVHQVYAVREGGFEGGLEGGRCGGVVEDFHVCSIWIWLNQQIRVIYDDEVEFYGFP